MTPPFSRHQQRCASAAARHQRRAGSGCGEARKRGRSRPASSRQSTAGQATALLLVLLPSRPRPHARRPAAQPRPSHLNRSGTSGESQPPEQSSKAEPGSFRRAARLEHDDTPSLAGVGLRSCRGSCRVHASAATVVHVPRRLHACRAPPAGSRLRARRPPADRPQGSATRLARPHPTHSSPSRPGWARPRSSR